MLLLSLIYQALQVAHNLFTTRFCLCVLSCNRSCNYSFTLIKLILNKHYTVAVYHLRLCMKEDNLCLKNNMGDNSRERIICVERWLILCVLTQCSSYQCTIFKENIKIGNTVMLIIFVPCTFLTWHNLSWKK